MQKLCLTYKKVNFFCLYIFFKKKIETLPYILNIEKKKQVMDSKVYDSTKKWSGL